MSFQPSAVGDKMGAMRMPGIARLKGVAEVSEGDRFLGSGTNSGSFYSLLIMFAAVGGLSG